MVDETDETKSSPTALRFDNDVPWFSAFYAFVQLSYNSLKLACLNYFCPYFLIQLISYCIYLTCEGKE